jgi:hypothetical protein
VNTPAPNLPTIPADLLGLHALTMTAPWATAIMRWGKRWENRGWTPPLSLMGQRIGIHQGAAPTTRAGTLSAGAPGRAFGDTCDSLVVSGLCPVGYDAAVLQALADSRMLLGTCVLLDFCEVFEDHAVSRFAKPGAKLERDPWMIPGGFAWHLADPELRAEPVPMVGLQKLWRITQDRAVKR